MRSVSRSLGAIYLAFLALLLSFDSASALVRIKDIADLRGMRSNQLVGYGIVIGLNGSGDTMRNSPFTEQSLQSMLERMGVNVRESNLRSRNVAAVVVTAELPPFIGNGARIDVSVGSLGDAASLQGGTLLVTPLMGADGNVYAVAQGSVSVSGFAATGDAGSLTQGVPTAGSVSNGALIEKTLPDYFSSLPQLVLELKNPDFKTAVRVTDAINAFSLNRYGLKLASELDYRSVQVQRPAGISSVRFISQIEGLMVQPDTPARVVVDERTGTVVIGQNVRISTVAVTHGNLTVRVSERPEVSQPSPFAQQGETTVVPRTDIDVVQEDGQLQLIGGTDLQTLVRGLNRIGLKPSGIIAILQAIKQAGALQATLVVK
ncbi:MULTISPECIES: flagellar basal body P-ring protein FlgI [unclassified Pseudovibrio]|uniref:flagellar basal body P-ring protein FlgI n=1 Tax=unclassified Pseudovibrio TaxID=2627060 RepID=UPI0007AE540B|nr:MULTISPECIES: flagellar basal body P-ring protein FlgI [unclassified Pseudovibrio]KZK95993.1 Flagellar P-ring protein precursor [Pseudovibrio sp. W74]KZL08572.1 Flagellar P-ring protein precursor [Pseudovibrio sp. Ad14]